MGTESDCSFDCTEHITCQPKIDWETMSLWEKWTDKDPRRPAKTWRSRLFWSWPISHYGNLKIGRANPRIRFGKQEISNGLKKPYVEIRTTKFHGPTYKDIPLDNAFRLNWWGVGWGWK